MIVRISGSGQFELADDAVRNLDTLDTKLTDALHENDDATFHAVLKETIDFIQHSGTPLAGDRVLPSQVIVPPEDVTLDEAKEFFTDEGLMEPLPA